MRMRLGIALVVAALTVPLTGCVVRLHDEPHRHRDRDRDWREEQVYRGHLEEHGRGYAEVQGLSRRGPNSSNVYLGRVADRG